MSARQIETEDDPPSRWYVRYESKRIINALKKKHGDAWRDEVGNHFEIMELRDFDSFTDAKKFRQKIEDDGFYAELMERKFVAWVPDLHEWQWEGHPFEVQS